MTLLKSEKVLIFSLKQNKNRTTYSQVFSLRDFYCTERAKDVSHSAGNITKSPSHPTIITCSSNCPLKKSIIDIFLTLDNLLFLTDYPLREEHIHGPIASR